MSSVSKPLLGAVVAVLLSGTAFAQTAPVEIEVIHAMAGDSAAPSLNLLIQNFEASGQYKWKDNAIAGGAKARQTMANRAVGGDPGAVNQVHSPLVFRELVDAGLMVPVSPEGWQDLEKVFPPALWSQMVAADGSGLIWTPNAMGLHNVGIYNADALAAVGMEPPESIDDVFAFLDAIKAKGDMIPLAWSEVPAQMLQVFMGTTAAAGGPATYNALFAAGDAAAIDTPEFRKVAETFKRLKAYTDEGRVGRTHQDAATMVVGDQAAMQYMGSHVLNVYISAGAEAGVDYVCRSVGGVAVLGPNGFMYGKPKDDAQVGGQQAYVNMITDPAVQSGFAALAGSLPVRTDADTSGSNKCTTAAAVALENPGNVVLDPSLTMSQNIQGLVTDAIVGFWADDAMTVDTFVANVQSALQS